MKAQDLDDAREIAQSIESGTATRRDLAMLLIYAREDLPNDMVRDVAHSVAHVNRDRGHVFTHVDQLVRSMLDAMERGGTVRVRSIYRWSTFLATFCKDLGKQGIKLNPSEKRATDLRVLFEDLLADVKIKISDARIADVRFKLGHDAKGRDLIVAMQTVPYKDSQLDMPDGFRFGFPVF